jgi:hypothetical protein
VQCHDDGKHAILAGVRVGGGAGDMRKGFRAANICLKKTRTDTNAMKRGASRDGRGMV